ncbi:MAG: hypothetical protein WA726_12050, partial [Acidimicrobiia bacterium]
QGARPNRLAGAKGVEARAFLRLQLEQFDEQNGAAGGGCNAKPAFDVHEQKPGLVGIGKLQATVDQALEEIGYVESGYKRLRQRSEFLEQRLILGHPTSL